MCLAFLSVPDRLLTLKLKVAKTKIRVHFSQGRSNWGVIFQLQVKGHADSWTV